MQGGTFCIASRFRLSKSCKHRGRGGIASLHLDPGATNGRRVKDRAAVQVGGPVGKWAWLQAAGRKQANGATCGAVGGAGNEPR